MPLLDHLRKHVAEPRYARLLINIAHRVIDIYAAVVSQCVVIQSLNIQAIYWMDEINIWPAEKCFPADLQEATSGC